MCGFRVDSHPLVGILTAKGRRKRRRAVWRVGKVDPALETRRPDRFPGPPPVCRLLDEAGFEILKVTGDGLFGKIRAVYPSLLTGDLCIKARKR